MLKFLKNWALLVAICLGFLLHDTVGRLMFITPYLLFTMLLLTFCSISPRDLRFERLHLALLGVQVLGTLVAYALFAPFGALGAQAAAVSVFMPTATAAAVITGMLGGGIAFTAAYTCLCSIIIALLTPLLLPFVAIAHGAAEAGMPGAPAFFTAMLTVAGRVMPVILLPLVLAWLLQCQAPRVHKFLLRWHEAAFWLWALLLVVLMGSTFNFVLSSGAGLGVMLGMSLVGGLSCVVQFIVGKTVGARYGRRISGGQSLAQKNAALGMWLSFQYLDPVIALCCAAYSVTQNTINSFQLWRFRRAEAAGQRLPREA